MDNREIRTSLGIISDILGILNKEIVDIYKRVSKLEASEVVNSVDDYEYTTIKIPLNASNLDVLMKVFNCKVMRVSEDFMHFDIDQDTGFRKSWLNTKYKEGCKQ